ALARQPFLWRAIAKGLTEDVLLNGDQIGHFLNSYWSDPLASPGADGLIYVFSSSGDRELLDVSVPRPGDSLAKFSCVAPLVFYGQARNIVVDSLGRTELLGSGERGGGASFLLGDASIISSELDVS